MVSSISSNSDDSIQLLMAQMFQKMKSADTDGIAGLSKDELSSIDSSNDVGGSAFLKSLTDQFSSLDADKNGQLSSEEISKARPSEPMGPPPGMDLSSSTENKMSELGDSLGDLASSFLDKLISTYKNSGLSDLASSLNLST